MNELGAHSAKELLAVIRDKRRPLRERRNAVAVIGLRRMESADWDLFELKSSAPELRRVLDVTTSVLIHREPIVYHQRQKTNLQSVSEATGARTEQALIRYLKKPQSSSDLRANICTALGDLVSDAAIPALLRVLATDRSKAGWAAMHALVNIRSRRSTLALMSIVQNGKFQLARINAMYVLRWVQDPRADDFLLRTLRDRRRHRYIRNFAAEGLTWQSRQIEIVEALLDATRDKSAFMRYSAIHSLDRFWDQPGVDEIMKRKIVSRLRECTADREGIKGYDDNNGQRARQVLSNYRRFGNAR